METTPVKVGVVGAGVISEMYVRRMAAFDAIEVVAVADLLPERAAARAKQFGIEALSIEALLNDPRIEIVVNLTIPAAHAPVGIAALEAGKSVYSEKPLAIAPAEGRPLLDLAAARGLRLGCAPDTFLGGGLQTCRKLLDDGAIGEPVGATAFLVSHGPEGWHPDPAFLYGEGAGPLFDVGVYYVTALVALLGPVRRATGAARITFPERVIGSGPKQGQSFPVAAPTHVAGVLEFAGGPIASLVASFDVWASELPRIELYGTEGTLSLPDPNTFGGPVRLRRAGENTWREIPLTHPHTDDTRGLGVADLARGLRTGRPHRASGELAYHVLDAMQAIVDAADVGCHVALESTCERPAPLPPGLPEYHLDG